MNKAVFLDRDGTINKEIDYLTDPEKLELLPKVSEAIKTLNEAGFKIIIVTNQSAIAKGLLTTKRLKEIHDKLLSILSNECNIDAIYYCPHHADENCRCRKPKPGLLLKASKKHSINLSESYMVGDKLVDIETGKNAGCKTILVKTGYGEKETTNIDSHTQPDFIVNNLYSAAKIILNRDAKSAERTNKSLKVTKNA